MNILAFDSATDKLYIALRTDKGTLSCCLDEACQHSEELLPSIISLCGKSGIGLKDINMIVTTRGPGSFTGLRIGMATAKGIAMGALCPVRSVSSLLCYSSHLSEGRVVAVIDAKKARWYTAVFDNGKRISEDSDLTDEEVAALVEDGDIITGPDSGRVCEMLENAGKKVRKDSCEINYAEALLSLWQNVENDDIGQGPVYIRRSDAEEMLLARKEGKQ